ncbi:hypothetical protein GOC36_27165 [Sinorhizobium meliloti]|nr:hypothetical protein [Sinorhizobium meliloti]
MLAPLRLASFALALLAAFVAPCFGGGAGVTYQERPVIGGGRLEGRILAADHVPITERILITKDQEICGNERMLGEDLPAGAGLAGAIIFFPDIVGGKPFATNQTTEIMQKGCRFISARAVNGPNARLRLANLDSITHNIHVSEVIGRGSRAIHNVGQYPGGSDLELPVTLTRGNVVRLTCGIHSFMETWIFVARNPYYAVADENGAFAINDIPAGQHRLALWHPSYGAEYLTVTMRPGQRINLTHSLRLK